MNAEAAEHAEIFLGLLPSGGVVDCHAVPLAPAGAIDLL